MANWEPGQPWEGAIDSGPAGLSPNGVCRGLIEGGARQEEGLEKVGQLAQLLLGNGKQSGVVPARGRGCGLIRWDKLITAGLAGQKGDRRGFDQPPCP